jgi:predicted nucleotidyltransferase
VVSFVFGSLADGSETAGSDVDLMVIGNLGFKKLTALLSGASEQVGREINPHVMSNLNSPDIGPKMARPGRH